MVSIIIPIYNGEEYLKQCLDTVVNQTYKNIEIILVNDGSKDRSLEICNQYAQTDARCKVITQENGGVTKARRNGVRMAEGEYIMFVDCDDWLEADAVETFVDEMKRMPVDIMVSAYIDELGNGISVRRTGTLGEGIHRGEEFHNRMFYGGALEGWGIWPSLWAKLFKRELLEKSLSEMDDRIFYGEDAACLFTACLLTDAVAVTNKAKYHYRRESITSVSSKSDKRLLDNMLYLHEYLDKVFRKQENCGVLLEQLGYYMINIMNHAGQKLFHIPYNLMEAESLRAQVKEWKERSEQYANQQRYVGKQNESQEDKAHRVNWLFPFYEIGNARRIILYGAGKVGQSYYYQLKKQKDMEVIAVVDKNADKEKGIIGIDDISNYEYDCIVIGIASEWLISQVIQDLTEKGISREKIYWTKPMKVDGWYIEETE